MRLHRMAAWLAACVVAGLGGGRLWAAPPPSPGSTVTVWVAEGSSTWIAGSLSLARVVPAALLPWSTHAQWLPELLRAVRRDGTTHTTTRVALALLVETAHPATTRSAWLSAAADHPPIAFYMVVHGSSISAYWLHGHWTPWNPKSGWDWLPPPTAFPPPSTGSHPATCTGAPPRGAGTLDGWSWEPRSRIWAWTYALPNGGVVTCRVAAPSGLPRVTTHPGWAAAEAIAPLRHLAATDPAWVRHWWPASMTPDPTVAALLVLARLSPAAWGDPPVTLHHTPSRAVQRTLRLLGWGPAIAMEVWPVHTAPPPLPAPSHPWEPWAAGGAGLAALIGGVRRWRTRTLTPRL